MKKFVIFTTFFVVFTLFLNTFTLSAFPSDDELKGTLQVLAVDEKDSESGRLKNCSMRYFIQTDRGETIPVTLPLTAPPNLSSGQRITISGDFDSKKSFIGKNVKTIENVAMFAPTISGEDSIYIEANSYLPPPNPIRKRKIAVILITFESDSIPTNIDKDTVENFMFKDRLSVSSFYNECSYGKMKMDGECLPMWVKLPHPASYYGRGGDEIAGELNLIKDAIFFSDNYIDYKNIDGVLFVRTDGNEGWGFDFSTLGKWNIETNDGSVKISVSFVTEGDIRFHVMNVAHESGHGCFDLSHSNSLYLPKNKLFTYGDYWSVMGCYYTQIHCLDKYLLGWISMRQIKILESCDPTIISLYQRELRSNGIKLIVVPFHTEDTERHFYFFEYFYWILGKFDPFYFRGELKEKKKAVLFREYLVGNGYFKDGNSLVYTEGGEYSDYPVDLSKQFNDNKVIIQVLENTGSGRNSKAKISASLPKPIKPSITLLEFFYKKTDGVFAKIKIKNSSMEDLKADIVFNLYDSDGKKIYTHKKKGVQSAIFKKINLTTGKFRVVVMASKEGYADVTTEVVAEF